MSYGIQRVNTIHRIKRMRIPAIVIAQCTRRWSSSPMQRSSFQHSAFLQRRTHTRNSFGRKEACSKHVAINKALTLLQSIGSEHVMAGVAWPSPFRSSPAATSTRGGRYNRLPLMAAVELSPSIMSTSRPHKKYDTCRSKHPTTPSTTDASVCSEQPWLYEESTSTQMPHSPVMACTERSGSNILLERPGRSRRVMLPSSSVSATS